jgi:hypothetical protein
MQHPPSTPERRALPLKLDELPPLRRETFAARTDDLDRRVMMGR